VSACDVDRTSSLADACDVDRTSSLADACDVDRTSSLATTEGRNAESHCITCGDVAVSMRVLSVDDDTGLARCADASGELEDVDVALVEPLEAGDAVLVHAGVALVKESLA
jgi:hydrogenase maturation factor